MNLDKDLISEPCGEAVLFLQERLKTGCYCVDTVDDGQKSRARLKDTISSFLNLGEFDHSDIDFLLICCGLLEGLFHLYTIQHTSGSVCPSLLDLISLVLRSRDVADHLITFVLCDSRFLSFASTKALIHLLKAECISSESSLVARDFCSQWLAATDEKTLGNKIGLMEHLFLIFDNVDNGAVPPYSQQCILKKVDPTRNEVFGEMLECCMLQAAKLFPDLIKSVLSWDGSVAKVDSLHSILRLLTRVFEKPSAIKDVFLRDASTLVALLTSEMPALVWERVCGLLKDIMDYQSTIVTEKGTSGKRKLALASQFLYLANGKLWTRMPHNDGIHGFGGPFNEDSVRPVCSIVYTSANKPLFQSFLLCNLASLATVASQLQNGNENTHYHDTLIYESINSIQEFIQSRLCLQTDTQNTGSDVGLSFCVKALSLFDDQDDALVQSLLCFLDISISMKKLNFFEENANPIYSRLWNPHFQFYIFLLIVNKDYNVLLDLLISEETCFLLYFLKYLKLSVSDWEVFVESHKSLQMCGLSQFDGRALHVKRSVEPPCIELSSKLNVTDKEMEKAKVGNIVDYELSSEDSEEEQNCTSPVKWHLPYAEAGASGGSVHAQLTFKNTLFEVVHVFNCLLNTIEKQLDKNLFPYNAKPLVKLLKTVTNKYT